MATTHAPGTGVGPGRGRDGRSAVTVAAVAAVTVVTLALAAVVVPFGSRDIDEKGAQASATTHPTPSSPSTVFDEDPGVRAGVGPRGDLPALLPAARTGSDRIRVRLGDVTDGVLRRTPDGTWQVRVRWNGRIQPVATRGPARLGEPTTAHASASWVSAEGLLYTRVPTGPPGRFRVYAWVPRGGTAYTPPTLVATGLGRVCFNASFTAFGDCRSGA